MVDNVCRVVLKDGVFNVSFRAHELHQVLQSSIVDELTCSKSQGSVIRVIHGVKNTTTETSIVINEVNSIESKFAVINCKDHTSLNCFVTDEFRVRVCERCKRIYIVTWTLVTSISLKDHSLRLYFRKRCDNNWSIWCHSVLEICINTLFFANEL